MRRGRNHFRGLSCHSRRVAGARTRWHFYEADDFHPPANIKKMRHGVPLTDEDRKPWLERLRELIKRCVARRENAVLACSALKQAYRRHLRVNAQVNPVFLHGEFALIANQLRHRRGHFMDPALLQSQFDTLEEPEPAERVLTIELGRSPRELVEEIKRKLRLDCAGETSRRPMS